MVIAFDKVERRKFSRLLDHVRGVGYACRHLDTVISPRLPSHVIFFFINIK